MKKIITAIVLTLILTVAPAFASGGRPHKPNMNAHIWGSDDHQKKGNPTTTGDPVSVPEPATLILLGGGLVALAGYKRWRGGK